MTISRVTNGLTTGLRRPLLLALVLGLCSCSSLRPPEHVLTQPPLELERYFAGRTVSWGIIEDRFGKVRRQFSAELFGEQRGGVFHLDQKFLFSDGKTERRLWQIRRVDAQNYEATATGIQGIAHARIQGGAVHLSYAMKTSSDAGKGTSVKFDQWIWRQDDKILFNRADVSKFGIRVVRVAEVFQKGAR